LDSPASSSAPTRWRAPEGARAYRVLYWSTGLDGKRVDVSGVVIAPHGSPPPGGRPVVAWAHPTTGVVCRCAPSLARVFFASIQGLGATLDRRWQQHHRHEALVVGARLWRAMDKVVSPQAVPIIDRLTTLCIERWFDMFTRGGSTQVLEKSFLRVHNLADEEPCGRLLVAVTI
jgi:hypothetical protein